MPFIAIYPKNRQKVTLVILCSLRIKHASARTKNVNKFIYIMLTT